ncbi:tetratricopeptide repeat protein [Streptomyces sp. 6N223]|uniref:tetratricopeptide repeat protein n=1 Tax=Streptomyces sp. 6N223 TaxID=3457412 RepID=UPI003FD5DE7E
MTTGDGDDGLAEVRRAEALGEARRPGEAVAMLTGVVAREPDNAWAWAFLARFNIILGEAEEAPTAAARAVELMPQSAYAHRLLAQSLLTTQRVPEARQAAYEAVRLAPEGWAEHWTLARVLMSAQGASGKEEIRARCEQALVSAAEAVRLAPEEPAPHRLRARILERMGRYEEAVTAWQRSIALDPADDSAHAGIANLRYRTGKAKVTELVSAGIDVLAQAPQSEMTRHNVDVWLHRLLRRARWIALPCLWFTLPPTRAFAAEGDLTALPAPWPERLWCGALIAVLWAVVLWLARRRLPASAWRGMRSLVRRSWVVRMALLSAAWCLLCAYAMLLIPWGERRILQALAFAGAVPVLVTAYVDRSWRRVRVARAARGELGVGDWYGPASGRTRV